MAVENLKDVLDRSGIYHTELAIILSVHRTTVQKWLIGTPVRSRMMQNVVQNILARIESAIDSRKLPIPSGLSHHERLPAIRRALRTA